MATAQIPPLKGAPLHAVAEGCGSVRLRIELPSEAGQDGRVPWTAAELLDQLARAGLVEPLRQLEVAYGARDHPASEREEMVVQLRFEQLPPPGVSVLAHCGPGGRALLLTVDSYRPARFVAEDIAAAVRSWVKGPGGVL